ncbi:MAG: UDP-N-acetylmuramoyl-tripeptide--D-alanyl-D-alanine ligase [Thermodesulfobacteriota bacterium]
MITFAEIIEATGGMASENLRGEIRGVSIDTRTLKAGEIYIAIKGPNYDGFDFCGEALSKGASAVMVNKGSGNVAHRGGVVIAVEDTVRALGDLGAFVRRSFKSPVVAVAGSCGKTTTKEMIASILSRDRSILKTEGNRNNLIGLPLTLFGLSGGQSAAVVELGISEPDEMERLAEICSPDVALITNIKRAHMENFGTIESIGREKGMLYELAKPSCVKVVNIDDPLAARAADLGSLRRERREFVTFSTGRVADVRVIEERNLGGLDGVIVTFDVRGQVFDVRLRVPGLFNVANALAAIASVLPLGVYLDDIRSGLEAFTGLGGRMEVTETGLITLIDDSYNANPDSLATALETLGGTTGRKVAVIGEMCELGEGSKSAHFDAGLLAARLGIDIVVAVGSRAAEVAGGAMEGGIRDESVFAFKEKKEALSELKGHILGNGDVVLVKASRAAGLDLIAEGLKSEGDASCEACG